VRAESPRPGRLHPESEAAAREGNRWLACRTRSSGSDHLSEVVGSPRWAPSSREELTSTAGWGGAEEEGPPIGQTLGHTFGDAPAWTYPLLWGFGGAETDTDGEEGRPQFEGTLESVKWMTAFWKEACDEGGLAWTTRTKPPLPRNEISATLNGASIYIVAKRKPDAIKDELGQPMYKIFPTRDPPDGPQRRPAYPPRVLARRHEYSTNQQAAREFLKWLHAKEQFGKWFEIESGYNVGAAAFWEHHPMWERGGRRDEAGFGPR